MFRLFDQKTSTQCAVPDRGHGRLHVLGVGVGEAVLGGLLQRGDGRRLVDVLLAARAPVEESGVLQDPRVAVSGNGLCICTLRLLIPVSLGIIDTVPRSTFYCKYLYRALQ
jgi:hypothetical protein